MDESGDSESSSECNFPSRVKCFCGRNRNNAARQEHFSNSGAVCEALRRISELFQGPSLTIPTGDHNARVEV